MATNTVTLHRVLRATPDRVYRAFLDADARVKWLPPHGFTGKVHHLDATVGGTYKMSFTNFSTGHSHSFGGKYLELVPNERIRHTDSFDDPNLPGEMETTISIRPVFCGVELNIVQQGASRTSFQPRPVIWAGRSRWHCWRRWSRPRFRGKAYSPEVEKMARI